MTDPLPRFRFEHAGSHKPLAWPKYKLKECWTLVLCLMALRGQGGAVIVHNWLGASARRFTEDFHARRAAKVDPDLCAAPVVAPQDAGRFMQMLAVPLALLLMLLPLRAIVAVTRALLRPDIGPLVVYCDAHLSGWALVLAARRRGARTITLHHGLYRSDDIGSRMGVNNFVADHICLWDRATRQVFVAAGVAPERLLQTGEYGFAQGTPQPGAQTGRILLCPPYDAQLIAVFRDLGAQLPAASETFWSLHPMLRAAHGDLNQVELRKLSPAPSVAICGDSGVLMDALACGIPILTIADRPLAAVNLTLAQAAEIDTRRLCDCIAAARASFAADRMRFGFDPLRAAEEVC